jgi:hypothetical protein
MTLNKIFEEVTPTKHPIKKATNFGLSSDTRGFFSVLAMSTAKKPHKHPMPKLNTHNRLLIKSFDLTLEVHPLFWNNSLDFIAAS